MRTEAVTLLIILFVVMMIFVIVGWIAFRVEKRLRQRDTGIVFVSDAGSGSNGSVSVGCGDVGAGCGS